MLKNANIAAGMVLPSCQDTGTAIVIGKKGQRVWTGGDDEAALARGIYDTYTQHQPALLAARAARRCTTRSTPAPTCRRRSSSTPTAGDEYQFLFITKGGGSANKTFLFQETKALLNPEVAARRSSTQKMRTLGTAACPPYHLAIVIGGTSAELTLKTVKLASCRYLDDLPTDGNELGHAIRDLELEAEVLRADAARPASARSSAASTSATTCASSACRATARAARSASASRAPPTARPRRRSPRDGVFLEQLETNPAQYLPDVNEQKLGGDVVRDRPAPADERDPRHAVALPDQDAPRAERAR